ncbi:MAG: hypothetical protein ACRDCI_02585 [Plesiomonas shigelloides]
MEQILKSELQSKSAISIGVFDLIEQLDDGMVIIKSDERTKLKFFNGELDILMHGKSHYRINGIRSGGLMLAKAEVVEDSAVTLPETNPEPLPEYVPPVTLPEFDAEPLPEYVPPVTLPDLGGAVTLPEDNHAVVLPEVGHQVNTLPEG